MPESKDKMVFRENIHIVLMDKDGKIKDEREIKTQEVIKEDSNVTK